MKREDYGRSADPERFILSSLPRAVNGRRFSG